VSITAAIEEARCVINLRESVDISDAVDLKQALVDALLLHKDLCMDLSQVTDLDITAVQLLWAAARESKNAGTSFTLVGVVPIAITSTVREAGFEAFLESATTQSTQLN
jgi:anti-anti-sigma regulatory factor